MIEEIYNITAKDNTIKRYVGKSDVLSCCLQKPTCNSRNFSLINKILEINPHVNTIVSSGYSNDPAMNNFSKYEFSGRWVKAFKLNDLKKEVLNILSS